MSADPKSSRPDARAESLAESRAESGAESRATEQGSASERHAPEEPLSRRERRKLELRMRIVSAAEALFREQGFQATRVADICERADVAQKTFFNHFPAKQDVLREIAHAGIDELLGALESVRKSELTTAERLQSFFGTVAEHICERPTANRELVTEVVHLISGDREARTDQATRLRAAFSTIIEDGLERGEITREHDEQTLTEMLLGAYYALIFNYANVEDFPVRERAAASARFLAAAFAP